MMVNSRLIVTLLSVALVMAPKGALSQAQKSASSPCPTNSNPAKVGGQPRSDQSSGQKDERKGTSSNNPCLSTTPKEPSASERFPFPGEPAAPMPSGSSSNAPEAPAPAVKGPSTADQHPFPGAASPMPGSDSSSSSSSSSSDSSSSADEPSDNPTPDTARSPLDDKGNNPRASVRRKLPKVEKLQSDEERAAEDLEIAQFYEDKGDLNAAYLRARDAVKFQPSDPEAHFVLGHLAEKLHKRGEAIAEYNSYLQLEPDGQKIKQARKALAQLQRP
jgi:hypothetical protein